MLVNVAIVGHKGVGKTLLLRKFLDHQSYLGEVSGRINLIEIISQKFEENRDLCVSNRNKVLKTYQELIGNNIDVMFVVVDDQKDSLNEAGCWYNALGFGSSCKSIFLFNKCDISKDSIAFDAMCRCCNFEGTKVSGLTNNGIAHAWNLMLESLSKS